MNYKDIVKIVICMTVDVITLLATLVYVLAELIDDYVLYSILGLANVAYMVYIFMLFGTSIKNVKSLVSNCRRARFYFHTAMEIVVAILMWSITVFEELPGVVVSVFFMICVGAILIFYQQELEHINRRLKIIQSSNEVLT